MDEVFLHTNHHTLLIKCNDLSWPSWEKALQPKQSVLIATGKKNSLWLAEEPEVREFADMMLMTTTQNNEEKEEEKKDGSNNVCNNCEPTKTHSLPEQLHPIHLQSRQELKRTGCQWDQQCSWPQSWQQTTGEAMETRNDLLKHSSQSACWVYDKTLLSKQNPPWQKKEN